MRISENGLEMPRQWENCCCSVDLVDHRLTVPQWSEEKLSSVRETAVAVIFNCVTKEEEDGGNGDGGDVGVDVGGGSGGSAFPLTGGSHTRFKREQNSNWLLCWPASLDLVSTKRETGKYLFLYFRT